MNSQHNAEPTAAELRDQLRQRIGRLEEVNAGLMAACKELMAAFADGNIRQQTYAMLHASDAIAAAESHS